MDALDRVFVRFDLDHEKSGQVGVIGSIMDVEFGSGQVAEVEFRD